MKKNKINIFYLLVLSTIAFMQLSLISCSEDNKEGYGTPEITGVRVPDPVYADSLFTKSSTGQLIAITGTNLSNVLKIYINDQQVSFNSTMNTDHSVMCTIPKEENGFKLTAFDSTLKDEIRLETSHGTATFAFKILAPNPSIGRIQGLYPRDAGDSLYVYGKNLIDIEKIYFTDIPAAKLDTTKWKDITGSIVDVTKYSSLVKNHYLDPQTNSYVTSSEIGLVLPDIPYESGTLVVKTATGFSYIAYSKKPGIPKIKSVSSEYPEIGETVTIKGSEFVQVGSITYGDVTLTSKDLKVASSEDELSFVFNKKPTAGSGTALTITTPGGQVNYENFFNPASVLIDFDGNATDNGWGPNAIYEAAKSGVPPYSSDGSYARINVMDNGSNWWGTMIYFRKDWSGPFSLPGYDVIPSNASADDIYLAMEVYDNNSAYNTAGYTGYLRYLIQTVGDGENYYDNGFAWINTDEGTFSFSKPVISDIDGNNVKGKWYRHVIKLSNFACFKDKTYKDIVATGINQIRLMDYNQGTKKGNIDVCFDNIRIYYKK